MRDLNYTLSIKPSFPNLDLRKPKAQFFQTKSRSRIFPRFRQVKGKKCSKSSGQVGWDNNVIKLKINATMLLPATLITEVFQIEPSGAPDTCCDLVWSFYESLQHAGIPCHSTPPCWSLETRHASSPRAVFLAVPFIRLNGITMGIGRGSIWC